MFIHISLCLKVKMYNILKDCKNKINTIYKYFNFQFYSYFLNVSNKFYTIINTYISDYILCIHNIYVVQLNTSNKTAIIAILMRSYSFFQRRLLGITYLKQ